jgi:hypothetical protein
MRVLNQLPSPTQAQVFYWSGGVRTELAWNEELWRVHYGEDGPGAEVLFTRQMFIDEQCNGNAPYEFQDWALWELYDEYR